MRRSLGMLLACSLAATPVSAKSRDTAALMGSTVCVAGSVAGGGTLTASGFVVPPGDRVLTTAHGLAKAVELRVVAADGRVFPARLERLGNERADIALLAVLGGTLTPVRFGSVESVAAGDEVTTIGCPLGFEFSVTRGVVSAIRQSDYGYPVIQTDVPVNPGSSGGALFDAKGRVVGIVKGRVMERERIHFALPIDLGKALLDDVARQRQAFEVFNQAVMEPRLEGKVPLYRKALELAPDMAEARFNLGRALEELGKTREAEEEYRATLRLVPRYEPAALNLGALLHEAKRYADAIEIYRAALVARPESPKLRNNLALAYGALGQSDRARQELEKILAANDDYAPAHYHLALLYEDQLKDRRRAADHYRRYLALEPNADDAAKIRSRLDGWESGG